MCEVPWGGGLPCGGACAMCGALWNGARGLWVAPQRWPVRAACGHRLKCARRQVLLCAAMLAMLFCRCS
jgi:hypothetical protein